VTDRQVVGPESAGRRTRDRWYCVSGVPAAPPVSNAL